MFTGQCHCGNVRFSAQHQPQSLTECNCSLCFRYGSIWAYFTVSEVAVAFRDQPTVAYRWGDRLIDFHHCPYCGCLTHYTGTQPEAGDGDRVALNARMCDRSVTENIRIRHFDGADSWTFQD